MKICGITSEADARLLIKYGADYGGMVVFYPKSKRDITIDEAGKLAKMLKESDIKTVAVTVSPDTDKLGRYRIMVLTIYRYMESFMRMYIMRAEFQS